MARRGTRRALNVYAESSAILCWVLGGPAADEIRAHLAAADLVVASSLTLVECDRVLIRACAAGELSEAAALSRQAMLARAAEHWIVFDFDATVTERARRPFPAEPIRTLDAIHLATAALVCSLGPELTMLSLDTRVRASAAGMGFELLPERWPRPD